MSSRFRVALHNIGDDDSEVPLAYILTVKNVKSLYDYYQALELVHEWAEHQMRFVDRFSYSVECLDV